jgi:hypothetical protein
VFLFSEYLEQISFVSRRTLILVSKILQNIVNGIQFGDKVYCFFNFVLFLVLYIFLPIFSLTFQERTMLPFNPLITEFKDAVFHFLDDVSTGKRPRRKTCDAAGFKDVTAPNPSAREKIVVPPPTVNSGGKSGAHTSSAIATTTTTTTTQSNHSSHSSKDTMSKLLPAILTSSGGTPVLTGPTITHTPEDRDAPKEREKEKPSRDSKEKSSRDSKSLPPLPLSKISPRNDDQAHAVHSKLLGHSLKSHSESYSEEYEFVAVVVVVVVVVECLKFV